MKFSKDASLGLFTGLFIGLSIAALIYIGVTWFMGEPKLRVDMPISTPTPSVEIYLPELTEANETSTGWTLDVD